VPAIEPDNAKPVTLSAVLRQVRDVFDRIGDATILQVGEDFRARFGVGNGPRVLFVPEVRGSVGDAIEMGNPAAMSHGCDLYIRADIESRDDFTRHDVVCDLADLVIDLVQTAGAGRITWGKCEDDSPVKTDTGMGTGLALHFEFRRDIRHNPLRWAAEIVTAAGWQPGPLTPADDTSTPFLSSSPAAVYADASDEPINVDPTFQEPS
jgi:hypothetical protein